MLEAISFITFQSHQSSEMVDDPCQSLDFAGLLLEILQQESQLTTSKSKDKLTNAVVFGIVKRIYCCRL